MNNFCVDVNAFDDIISAKNILEEINYILM